MRVCVYVCKCVCLHVCICVYVCVCVCVCVCVFCPRAWTVHHDDALKDTSTACCTPLRAWPLSTHAHGPSKIREVRLYSE